MNIRKILILFLIIGHASTHLCFSQWSDPMKDKYLIVLDIQEYYTSGKLSKSSTKNIIDVTNQIIENTDSNRIIYLKRAHKLLNLSLSFPLVSITLDTSAMQLDNRLILVNENILTREKPNAFASDELIDFLEQNSANEIVVVGLLAEEFLSQSLIAGKELGYNMYMIPEATLGKSQKKKAKAIKKLSSRGIKVLINNSSNY